MSLPCWPAGRGRGIRKLTASAARLYWRGARQQRALRYCGVDTALIGRDAELARLRGLVDPPPAEGRVLLLLGDAGMGKTALLADAAGQARRAGLRVLSVTGIESEQNLAFAGLRGSSGWTRRGRTSTTHSSARPSTTPSRSPSAPRHTGGSPRRSATSPTATPGTWPPRPWDPTSKRRRCSRRRPPRRSVAAAWRPPRGRSNARPSSARARTTRPGGCSLPRPWPSRRGRRTGCRNLPRGSCR